MPFHPHKMLRNRKDPILVVQQGKKRGRAHALIVRAKIQTDLVPRVFAAGQFIIADKVVESCNYCEMSTILLFVPTSNHNPLRSLLAPTACEQATRCEPNAIPGALSFLVEKPGRIFCVKGAEQISSIKIWNGGECVPFEISFSVFLKRLDTNI